MKTKVSFLLLTVVALILPGCFPMQTVEGDGNLVTHQISITDYDEIALEMASMKVEYIQDDNAPYLQVTTDQNVYEKYEFIIEDGHKLLIRPKKEYRKSHNFRPTEFKVITNSHKLREVDIAGHIEFHANSPLVSDKLEFKLAGSGSINLHDTVTVDQLKISMAGSATVTANSLFVDELKGEIAGSGTMNLGGAGRKVKFQIAGSGDIHAYDLLMDEVDCEVAGSGDIEVYANNRIHSKTAGSGNIRYKGSATDAKHDSFGSGTLRKVD